MNFAGRLSLAVDVLRAKGVQRGTRALLNLARLAAHRRGRLTSFTESFVPATLDIEVSSVCNLRCPGCIHGLPDGAFRKPRARFMTLSQFTSIMDEVGPELLAMNMTPLGEAFLNPDIYDMLTCAKSYGISVSLDTNGHLLDARRLVATGLDEITFAVDGLDQESYATYRRGGNLQRVLDNAALLSAAVKAASSPMRILVKYFVNRYTESRVEEARAHFLDLHAVQFFTSFFVVPPSSWAEYCRNPYATSAELHRQWAPQRLPEYDLYETDAAEDVSRLKVASMPFEDVCDSVRYRLYVTSGGDAYPCCKAGALEPEAMCFGNAFESGVRAVFSSPQAKEFRRLYTQREGKHSLCATCWVNRARGHRVRYFDCEFTKDAGGRP